MTGALKLAITFRSFWRVGSGLGLTGRVDMLCARDDAGLPMIPGRHLRGILREATREAESLGWFSDLAGVEGVGMEDALFGARNVANGDARPGGVLRVENARLPTQDRDALAALRGDEDFDQILAGLFRTRRRTAIAPERGVAKKHSLRVEEVAIPLTLEAEVSPLNNDAPPNWREAIACCLPLIRHMGGGRTRGLGRCAVGIAAAADAAITADAATAAVERVDG